MKISSSGSVSLLLPFFMIACGGGQNPAALSPVAQQVRVETGPLNSNADPAELARISEALPKNNLRVRLNKSFWLGRDIFMSLGVERASVTGLATSVIGYIPATISRAGDRIVLTRSNQGLYGGSVLGPDLAINSYPIVSENDDSILVDLSSPGTPYGVSVDPYMATGGVLGTHSSSELTPRFEYVKSVSLGEQSLSFTNVTTVKSPARLFTAPDASDPNDSPSSEAKADLDPGLLSMTLRTDWVLPQASPDFEPMKTVDGIFGFFLTSPLVTNNGASTETYVKRINANKPFNWRLSANTPDAFVPAVTDGLKAWNNVFGRDVIQVTKAAATTSDTDPSASNLIWDDNMAVGMAFANWRTNPFTGEIVQAQIYMSGDMWAHQAELVFKSRLLEKSLREAATKSGGKAPGEKAPSTEITSTLANELMTMTDKAPATVENFQGLTPSRYFVGFNQGIAAEKAATRDWCVNVPNSADAIGGDDDDSATPDAVAAASVTPIVTELKNKEAAETKVPTELHQPYPNDDVTLQQFKQDVIRSVVMHEAGHTLGLRHNFKGSTVMSQDGLIPSGSIMDYNDLVIQAKFKLPGDIDRAIITSAYAGKAPSADLKFCTDEDVAMQTPDCNRFDAYGNDSEYFAIREQTLLMMAYHWASKGVAKDAQKMIDAAQDALLSELQIAFYPSAMGAESTGDKTFPARQAEAWSLFTQSRDMLSNGWPMELRVRYNQLALKLLALRVNAITKASNLKKSVIASLLEGVTNDKGFYTFSTRLTCVEALRKMSDIDARDALVKASATLKTNVAKKLVKDPTLVMHDNELRQAIEALLARGYLESAAIAIPKDM